MSAQLKHRTCGVLKLLPALHMTLTASDNVFPAGYVVASALIRLEGRTVLSAVKYFAECRPPGIYKRHYIQGLFKYSHELL